MDWLTNMSVHFSGLPLAPVALLLGSLLGWWLGRRNQSEAKQANYERDGLQRLRAELRQQLNEADSTLQARTEELKTLESEKSRLNGQVVTQAKRITELENQLRASRTARTAPTAELELQTLQQNVSKLQQELANRHTYENELKALIRRKNGERTQLTDALSEQQQRSTELEAVLNEAQYRSESLHKELQSRTQRLHELESELQDRSFHVKNLENDLDHHRGLAERLESQVGDALAHLEATRGELKAKRVQVTALQDELEERTRRLEQAESELTGQRSRLHELEDGEVQATKRVADLAAELVGEQEKLLQLQAHAQSTEDALFQERARSNALGEELEHVQSALQEALVKATSAQETAAAARSEAEEAQAAATAQADAVAELQAKLDAGATAASDQAATEIEELREQLHAAQAALIPAGPSAPATSATDENDPGDGADKSDATPGQIATLTLHLEQVQAQLQETEEVLEQHMHDTDNLRTELQSRAEKAAELEHTLAEQLTQLQSLHAELDEGHDRIAALQADLAAREAELHTLQQETSPRGAEAGKSDADRESTQPDDASEALDSTVQAAQVSNGHSGGYGRGQDGLSMLVPAGDVAERRSRTRPEAESTGSLETTDDLTVIQGIAPKLAAKLAEVGVRSLRTLAMLDASTTEALENQLQLHRGRVLREDWIGQAIEAQHAHHGEDLTGATPQVPSRDRADLLGAGHRDALDRYLLEQGCISEHDDDLSALPEVDAELSALLNEQGIRSYAHIALLDPAAADALETRLDLPPGTIRELGWAPQAAELHEEQHAEDVSAGVRLEPLEPATCTLEPDALMRNSEVRYVDDLKKIRGLGPKMERLLNENGLHTYWQLAQLDDQAIATLTPPLMSLASRMRRDRWPAQAAELHRKYHAQ